MDQQNETFKKALELLDKLHAEGFGKYRPRKEGEGVLRPQQFVALRQILFQIYAAKKKYVVLTAPTGSGKSVIAAAVAIIVKELSGYDTNLTTSSRVLQAQYGEDLKFDSRFKVVMGTANYACSLFRNDMGGMAKTVESACHDRDRRLEDVWPHANPAEGRGSHEVSHRDTALHGIRTIHEDQDTATVEAIPLAESLIDEVAAPGDSQPATRIKKACLEAGACSYYRARDEAQRAAIAIRSTQHMMFYIMYQVKVGGELVLQQRPLHIHDESHNLETVFRDFFSANFTDRHYSMTLSKIDAKRRETGAQDHLSITSDFSKLKRDQQNPNWSGEEKQYAMEYLHQEMGQAIERAILPKENLLREGVADPITSAEDFLRAGVQGKLMLDAEGMGDSEQAVVGWYKNTYHALSDARQDKQARAEGFKHRRRFAVDVKKEKDSRKKDIIEFSVSPLSLEGMADRYFGESHTLFMSATPQPPRIFEQMFGIQGQVAYIEIESDFPPERSPIFVDPVETITIERAKALGAVKLKGEKFSSDHVRAFAETEAGWVMLYAKLAGKIREVLEQFPTLPGIVPCSSYRMAKALGIDLADLKRVIAVEDGMQNRNAVEEFKRRAKDGEPVILISAGISEGHSFNDDISRLQIIPKMPYAARDGQMVELCHRWGNQYYDNRTATTLQQMIGRSMRSKSDYCITILLDQKFTDLKKSAAQNLYSKHFMKCLRWDDDWRTFRFPQD